MIEGTIIACVLIVAYAIWRMVRHSNETSIAVRNAELAKAETEHDLRRALYDAGETQEAAAVKLAQALDTNRESFAAERARYEEAMKILDLRLRDTEEYVRHARMPGRPGR